MIRWRHYNWTVLRATGPERVGPAGGIEQDRQIIT